MTLALEFKGPKGYTLSISAKHLIKSKSSTPRTGMSVDLALLYIYFLSLQVLTTTLTT